MNYYCCNNRDCFQKALYKRVLIEDLGLYAYKVQLTQELKPNDHGQ